MNDLDRCTIILSRSRGDGADEVPKPVIRQSCRVCNPILDDPYCRNVIISPNGTAHHSNGHESTFCGHDATGDDWWWPL